MRAPVAVLALFAPLLAVAAECPVQARFMPDARELQRRAAERAVQQARPVVPPQVSVNRPLAPVQQVMSSAPVPDCPPARQPSVAQTFGISGITAASCLPEPTSTPEQRAHAKQWVERHNARQDRPLIRAVDAGDARLVAQLIAGGEDVRKTERDGSGTDIGLVERAVSRWRGPATVEIAHRLLEAGADPSLANSGITALGRIARGISTDGRAVATQPAGALEVAADLLAHGATVGSELDLAVARDDRALVALMLAKGRPAQKAKDRALILATAQPSKWEAAKALVESGADPNIVPARVGLCCNEPLLDSLMVRTEINRDFIKFLLAHGLKTDVTLRTGSTALMQVLHDVELMQAFIDRGAKLDTARKSDGNTVLHLAARSYEPPHGYGQGGFAPDRVSTPQQRAATVALLLKRGADPNARNAEGLTPLMIAAEDVVPTLLAAGATANPAAGRARYLSQASRDHGGSTARVGPVGWALVEGREALAVELARNRPLDADDCGAVYYAATGGAVQALTALLAAKARTDLRDAQGRTPLIAAAGAGHAATVKALLDLRTAQVDEVTRFDSPMPGAIAGATALMAAAEGGHVEVVKLLLARGAKADARDRIGRAALDYAEEAQEQRAEVVSALQAGGAAPRAASSRRYEAPAPPTAFQGAAARELMALLDPGGKTFSLSPQPAGSITLPGDDSSVESIPCEDVAAFRLYAHAGEQGSIVVGRCRASAARVGQLAPSGDRHLQSFAAMFDKQMDPAQMRKAGWYYAKSAAEGGATFHFYPTLLVGHGILAVHNGVRLAGQGPAIVVQLAGYPMCERGDLKSAPVCAATEDTLKRLATAIASRVP